LGARGHSAKCPPPPPSYATDIMNMLTLSCSVPNKSEIAASIVSYCSYSKAPTGKIQLKYPVYSTFQMVTKQTFLENITVRSGDRGTVEHGAQWNFFNKNLLIHYSGQNKFIFGVLYHLFHVCDFYDV